MRSVSWLLLIFGGNIVFAVNNDQTKVDPQVVAEGEKKIADQILQVLEHFKQEDPVGIPGVEVPEPLTVPPQSWRVSFIQGNFENLKVYGLSQFRITSVNIELSQMKAYANMRFDKLNAVGNYTAKSFFKSSKGPFTTEILNLDVFGSVTLGVERDGKLRAQDIDMDFKYGTLNMNFENLGLWGAFLNSGTSVLLPVIKPIILQQSYGEIRTKINENLEKVAGDLEFPNSISPLDMIVADTRNKVREKKIDPYILKDYNYTKDFYKAEVSNTWITGLSSFYRVGNISFYVENNTLFGDFEVGTQKLKGETQWQLSFVGGFVSKYGSASFSVEYLKARFVVSQSLDTTKRPVFDDLDIDMGNIQVRCDGAGTLDYVVELAVNVLPNLLRYQILDGVEGPIKNKVQEQFDKINVEAEIKKKLATLKDSEMGGFKLSSFKSADIPIEVIEDEKFWGNT